MKYLIIFILILSFSCKSDIHKDYYSNGKLRVECRKKGKQFDGAYYEYYENGKAAAKGQFINGVMDGKWEYFYSNGNIKSIENRINGIVTNINLWDSTGVHQVIDGNGTSFAYYNTGQLMSRASFKNSKYDGKFETWHLNGQKQWEFYYSKGIPTGVWKYWDENGELIKTEKYP